MSRRLRALVQAEKAAEVPDLPPEAFRNQTMSTVTLDYNSESFHTWMTEAGLVRHEGESDMSFARRAFVFIKHHFHYQLPPPAYRRANVRGGQVGLRRPVCGFCGHDAGQRRAGPLAGRPLGDSQKPDERSGNVGQFHVKSEFFARGVGWVPVDASGAVSDARGGDFAYFGNDPGDLSPWPPGRIFCLIPSLPAEQNMPLLQGIVHWWRGVGGDTNGRFDESWTVRKE